MFLKIKLIKKLVPIILLVLINMNSFSQEKTKIHKIKKGETISSIARENGITIQDIYKLNPNSKKVLKLNSKLTLPISKKLFKNETDSIQKENLLVLVHQVTPKQTLYSISKKYKISIKNIKKWNPILENSSLEIGQIINISEPKNNKSIAIDSNNEVNFPMFHEVLVKETLYSLSKKYNLSIDELQSLNPETKNGLPVGFKLLVSKIKAQNNIHQEKIIEPEIKKEIEVIKTDTIATIETSKTEQTIILPEIKEIKNDTIAIAKPISNLELTDQLFMRASEQIGSRYRIGGTQPGAFDCSGLMIYTFLESGITLPRTSAEQSRFGTRINTSEAQKGDLIFFSTNGRGYVNHVGMVVDNIDGEIKFIHASVHGGVVISSLSERYYSKKVKHINRVLD